MGGGGGWRLMEVVNSGDDEVMVYVRRGDVVVRGPLKLIHCSLRTKIMARRWWVSMVATATTTVAAVEGDGGCWCRGGDGGGVEMIMMVLEMAAAVVATDDGGVGWEVVVDGGDAGGEMAWR
ncbi:hypothetical protein Tco_1368846 [Tanacetum coccineum]